MTTAPDRTPEASPERVAAQRRALAALSVCLLLAWLLLLLPLPWSLAAGGAGLVALVLLVRASLLAWRLGQRASAVATALMGGAAVLVLLGSSAISLVLYGPMHELQECRRDAITEQSRDQCQDRATESTASWISSLLGG